MPDGTKNGARTTSPGLFYGWIVVGAAFAVMAAGFGVAYAFTAFFESLQRDLGASRGKVSLIFSIAGFLYFGLGALSGPLADRWGPKRVVALGMAITAGGLALASQATELWQIYAAYGVGVGVGVGFAYVPAIGTVQRWFVRKRGLASGFAVSGIGVGTLALPPLAGWLIEGMGWRNTYLVLAAATLIVGVAASLVLDNAPEKRGLLPDGDAAPPPSAMAPQPAAAAAAVFTLRQSLRSAPFWLLYILCSFAAFALFIPFVHLVPYARDHGIGEHTALYLMMAIGIGSVAGRFVFGGVADRLGRRRALAVMFAGLTVMLLWWTVSTAFWALALFGLLFGAFYGGFVALIPAMTADYYGTRYVSSIIGVLYTSVSIGSLVGPSLAGYAFDLTQSYQLAILIGAAMMAIAGLLMMLAPDPARWRQASL
jgi:MFS family permease